MRAPALLRQLLDRGDRLGLAHAVQSRRSDELTPRTKTADRVVDSICPYCAVGCGQKLYVKDEKVVHIEGDPDSPISRGRLCPRGSSSLSLVNSPQRETKVLYRRPHAADWEELELDTRDRHDRRPGHRHPRAHLGRRRTAARSASPTSAAPRSTTRRTT